MSVVEALTLAETIKNLFLKTLEPRGNYEAWVAINLISKMPPKKIPHYTAPYTWYNAIDL